MSNNDHILGLDIGPNSIGWALLGRENGEIAATGVRIFTAGLDDLELDGKGKSWNLKRRDARSVRRGIERTSRRMVKLAHILQNAGLLPLGAIDDGYSRNEYFTRLDQKLDYPYKLRARALDEKLEPFEIGRALYHLAQRRGFLSNRKSVSEDEKEEGKVKESIGELQRQMDEAGARTLGEYFSQVDPHQERIRSRYTSRKMYEDEFQQIWEKQKEYYSALMIDELKAEVHEAIFYQRPLKSQKHLIGGCQLEDGQRRAPWALLSAQRYRYLSTLNNLIIKLPDGSERELTEQEYEKLADHLETNKELKFTTARGKKLLGLPKGAKFNLEEGGEKNIPGNRTAASLRKVFSDRWDELSDAEKGQVVEDLRSIVKDEALKKRAMDKWGLDEESADKLTRIKLDDGYCNYSRRALSKLVPLLRQRKHLQTAIRELYPDRWARTTRPLSVLPPLRECEDPLLSELRNPIVSRALTEIRDIVNAIVGKYGKPAEIRIELARELRQTSKQREEATKRMRQNERERKQAAKKIIDETSLTEPKRNDILKVLLADECDWKCPYTGKTISIGALFGGHPQFDIEHIIPLDRCLDDSYMNKTLCDADENRNVKRGKTPYEAYHGTAKWDEIISRVGKFSGRAGREKLRRFKMTDEETEDFIAGFTSRQLNDTRYASRLAKKYLGLLYGGVDDDGIDASGKRCVQATSGKVTATLRYLWGLNAVLGQAAIKSRDDHRHHAVDAIVVALTSSSAIKALSDAAKRGASVARKYSKVKPPWHTILEDARKAVLGITPSHRVNRRVRGALHKETFYSPPRDESGRRSEEGEYVHVHQPLESLSARDVASIVDPVVRKAVEDKLQQLGETDPAKAFKDPSNYPRLKSGQLIKKLRVRHKLEVVPVGQEEYRQRYVMLGNNHHMEIVEVQLTDKQGNVKKDKDGKPMVKWEGYVVSMFEAYQRKKRKEPIVKRDHGPGKKFLFSIAGGDTIELQKEEGKSELFVVRTVAQSTQIRFVPVHDARTLLEIGKVGLTAVPETLRKWNCRKVAVNRLGEVHYQND
ncbi:type II CRISPR RNA-guided endonuclease Cas9 [bacterium]|nr:type II CRISPR RNA-guided endonuclease Cas9 [bacterium]